MASAASYPPLQKAQERGTQQAARSLGISYRALLYMIRDAGLPSNRAKRAAEPPKDVAAD